MNVRRITFCLRATATLALSSAALFVWAALARSLPDDVEHQPLNPPRRLSAGTPAVADITPDDLIAQAQDRAPFSGHESAAPSGPIKTTPVLDDSVLRVLGTVFDSLGASFAICQLGSSPVVLLHVGQRLGGYELRRVDYAGAVFLTSEGERIERRVPRAGS